jgi:hypothetical protein
MERYEDHQRDLNPNRTAEQRSAVAEIVSRLQGRGIVVSSADDAEDLVDLLTEVERFEAAVEMHGGDLMVDDLDSEPDDPHFVLPRRRQGEALRVYTGRIEDATAQLGKHPNRPD